MTMWQIPKVDWTRHDFYGPGDLNRVEANTQYIADYLATMGYTVQLEPVRIDRDALSVEFAGSLSRVERNISALTEGFIEPPGFQQAKSWVALQVFDWLDANRLERNLQLLYCWMVGVVASYRRCGTFVCGEGGEIY